MKPPALRLASVLVLMAAGARLAAAPDAPAQRSTVRQIFREEFKFQGLVNETEAPPVFARAAEDGGTAEIILLPNYVVRELPNQTKRPVDEALARSVRLSSGAKVKKDITQRTRFEALLPLSLDLNTAGERVLRFDVLRLSR